MKRLFLRTVFICLLVVLAGSAQVFAAPEIRSARKTETKVFLGGSELYFTLNEPLISVTLNGGEGAKTYMPLRAILERLGYGVIWDAENNAIRLETPAEPCPESSREWFDGDAMIISTDVELGYLNIAVGEFEEDTYIKWNVVAQPHKDIVLKEAYEKVAGKTIKTYLLDADRALPEGSMAAIIQQTRDGEPTGKYAVLVININTAAPDEKPVVYLYPEAKTDVSVKLDYDGLLDCAYPAYDGGWNVTAYPDGTLINKADGLEYSYLFWEGRGVSDYDFSEGFVVKGKDTAAFLRKTLSQMGLTPKEYNEFIVYWLPKMQNNPYNLISFQKEAYTEKARLYISPQPESMLRVFMAYKPLDKFLDIPAQELAPFERNGFTVIEWGGALVK